MAVTFTSREISAKYNRFARWFDLVEGVPDVLGVRKLRQRLLRQASGQVLEVAVGTGKNLRHYPGGCRIIGVDVSREMLSLGRELAAKLSKNVSFSLTDAESLPFSDNSFDTVVSSLTACTFPNPVAALKEMARVCRPSGRILLLEHGLSDYNWLGRLQNRTADWNAKQLGCHWNREPLQLVRHAGLKVVEAERSFFGIFYQIKAQPR
jgi:ubiquinone/menaquinone biosynthesis C-methylase UbiE